MVYIRFVSDDGENVVYDYMPESKDAPCGTLSVSRNGNKRALIKKSPVDDWSEYRGHAWSLIERMVSEGHLKDECFAAWY